MKISPLADIRIAEILLVEDNEDDVFLTRAAFEANSLRVNLHHVSNGEECLKFLRKQAPYIGTPFADLILLDMHMPVMNGYEVLTEIVNDERLRSLPVVVLTTSHDAEDIKKMYDLRCSSYITKPVDFDNFVKAVNQFSDYWLTLVVVPTSTST